MSYMCRVWYPAGIAAKSKNTRTCSRLSLARARHHTRTIAPASARIGDIIMFAKLHDWNRARGFLVIVACALGTALALAVTGCDRSGGKSPVTQPAAPIVEDSLSQITMTGVMRVGYIPYPPAVIKDDKTGELSGDFVAIARYIASELGVKLEFHEATWSTFITGLQNGQYDISIACTYIKVGRAQSVAYSRPIAYLGNSAAVRVDDRRFQNVTKVDQFDQDGITIAVVQGESSHEYAKSHFVKATLRVLSGADLSAPLALVANGQADVGMSDAYVTATYCAANPSVRDVFGANPYDLSPMAWAVRPHDYRLLNFINNSLDFLETSGKLRQWQEEFGAHWVVKEPQWRTR